jgi:hypothetical protein
MLYRRVEDGKMQRKKRLHRIQLLAYDLVNAPLWSLPMIGPSPTPMPSGDDSPYTIHLQPQIYEGASFPGRFPRKIHLIPG